MQMRPRPRRAQLPASAAARSAREPRLRFPTMKTSLTRFLLGMLLVFQSGIPELTATDIPAPRLARTFVLAGVSGTRPGVGVPGRIDHMAYDPATQRLFVAALENGSLEVLDLASGRRAGSVTGLKQPQGLAVVPGLACAALACGGDGTLRIYDARTLKEQRVIQVGDDADNVRYDAGANTVLVSYGNTNAGAIAILEAGSWRKLRDIVYPSRPESFRLDPAGNRLYANLPGGVRAVRDGGVAATDRSSGKLEVTVTLAGRARNFPMSLDAQHQRLFIATRRPAKLIALDARSLAVLSEADCTDDSDDLFHDPQTGRVLVIGGGFRPDLQAPGTASPASPSGLMGALDVFTVGLDHRLQRVATVLTAVHARTGLFVPERRAIYIAVPQWEGRDPEIREYTVD